MEQVPKEGVSPVQEPGAGEKRESRNKFWAIFALFFVVLVVVSLYLAWQWYLSPQAKQNAQNQENWRLYTTAMQNYESAMRADTYGSSTPEGTLQMFIDALKQGDVELASKYFMLDDAGSRTKWEDVLMDTAAEDGIRHLISLLQQAQPDKTAAISVDYFVFAVRDVDNHVIGDIDLKMNTYSGVWKIESM